MRNNHARKERASSLASAPTKKSEFPISKGGLDAGEAESIALASSRKLMVIVDDRVARSFAEVMGVTFLGTAGILFYAFVKQHLSLTELEDAVHALSKTIWLAPAVVADLLRKAREVSDEKGTGGRNEAA